ncbi:MAG: TIGR02466 family protein [Pseudomonadota bacterium]
MSQTEILFVTRLYCATLKGRGTRTLNVALDQAAQVLAADDAAGQSWSAAHGYGGYTSYASLNDLPWRFPEFAELQQHLDVHVSHFADELELDLGDRNLILDSLWVNVLAPGGHHSAHIHPHAAISGTYYVTVPDRAGAIRFEDPRLSQMMAAPPRTVNADRVNRNFVSVSPKAGQVLLWESWLRHEVPVNNADSERISISFNYRWGE